MQRAEIYKSNFQFKRIAGYVSLEATTTIVPNLTRPNAASRVNVKRNRLGYFVAGCVVVALGLSSRRYAASLPEFLARYAGDTLYATMIFIGFGFLFPRWRSLRVAVVSLIFCYAIEVSQLYHAPWIDTIRHTRVGGLVLGYGFLWSDLLCYTLGVILGFVLELAVRKTVARRRGAGPDFAQEAGERPGPSK